MPKSSQKKLPAELGFGKFFTDQMFLLNYDVDRGWHSPRMESYGPLQLNPAASSLHYGQALFEGLKAYRRVDGQIQLFRPEFHCRRMAQGAPRLCMPSMPEEMMLNAIERFVASEHEWVPSQKGSSLYLRPTLIATEPFLGVRPSRSYLFFIIGSPVGAYYSKGVMPLRIWIERKYARTAPGGLGAVKAAANYAASLLASNEAKQKGYDQVLWMDAATHQSIEEVGTMNVFFRIGDEIITPALTGTILGGSTRAAVIHLLKEWGLNIVERAISIHEIGQAYELGRLTEIFGTGTAAVISPVSELAWEDGTIDLQATQMGKLSARLYETLTALQYGEMADPYGWTRLVSPEPRAPDKEMA